MAKSEKLSVPSRLVARRAREAEGIVIQMLEDADRMSNGAAELRSHAAKIKSAMAKMHGDADNRRPLRQTVVDHVLFGGNPLTNLSASEEDAEIDMTATLDVRIVHSDKWPISDSAFPLPRKRIDGARRTIRLLEHTNSKIVDEQAREIRDGAKLASNQRSGKEVSESDIQLASSVLAWAEARKQRLREAYAILSQANKQVKKGILPAVTEKEHNLREAYLKAHSKFVTSKKQKLSQGVRKSKNRHAMETRSQKATRQQEKQNNKAERNLKTKINPQKVTSLVEQRHQRDMNLMNDPTWGPMIAACQEQTDAWLATRKTSKLPRESTPACFQAYALPVGELPMMSGAISISQHSVDHTHLLNIKTNIYKSGQEDFIETRRRQFITAEEDWIDGTSEDEISNYGSRENRTYSENEEDHFGPALLSGDTKGQHSSMRNLSHEPLNNSSYDGDGQDHIYTRQAQIPERITNNLFWDID